MKTIIEKRSGATFETRGEWSDRIMGNFGRLIALLMLILAVVCAVAHIASGMWVNFALDFVIITIVSAILANLKPQCNE